MWRAEHQDAGKATPEKYPVYAATISAFQHPAVNSSPFATFPTWVIGPATLPDGPSLPSRSSTNAPGSIVHNPSDLLPNGLLATPQPSTPATTLLKVLINSRLTIPGQETGNGPANGHVTDSPANASGHALRPLDSLVLPSPSLLPGGVHSLPTPTSASSQHLKAIDGYGSRGSPLETASSKDSVPCQPADAKGSRPAAGGANRRVEASPTQHHSRSGSSGSGVAGGGRMYDGSSSSHGSRHMQQPVAGGSHTGYGGAGGYQPSQQAHAPKAAAAAAAAIVASVSQPPGSPAMGFGHYYMAQMGPGPMMMHHPASNDSAGGVVANGRASAGGSGAPGAMREGSGGSGWRGSRSAGGSGANGSSQGGKHQYGAPQQMMQGPMGHDGSASGPYGMAHMHPGPYAVYGMMAPGIVMPPVLPPVVGSPRGLETHGPLGHHQQVHMGPMVMPHGHMAMGMGMHVHAFPAHGHHHMGMHPHMAAHGFSHGHHYHGMGHGGYGHAQQPYGHSGGGAGMHAHERGTQAAGRGKGSGGGAGSQQQQQSGKAARAAVAAGGAANGGGEGGGGGASGATSSARDSPVAGRGRREKMESKTKAERERKPGNSRAPALIAQCVAEMPSLDQQLQNLVRQLTPGEDELAAYQAACQVVSELVGSRWPEVKVHLFGSGANGLSIAGSNAIDITLEVPGMAWDDHAAKSAMVSALGELASGVAPASSGVPPASDLEPKADAEAAAGEEAAEGVGSETTAAGEASTQMKADGGSTAEAVEVRAEAEAEPERPETPPGVGDDTVAPAGSAESAEAAEPAEERPPLPVTAVCALPKARTPVVKMTVVSTQTRVDVTINNLLAVSNTRMLGHYCEVDPRLRQLVLFVKHWARTRSVNDAYRGSLSSYAYVLLCIWLLQQRKPAILPVLQQREPHTYDTAVGPWRCSYNDQVQEVKDFGADNKESLAELLVAFFDHWAWRHDYNGSVVCVRTGGTVTKASKEWTKRQGNERHLMCIEDPFELSHDLGRTIDKAAVQVLRREFERAARIFASNPDPLTELLAPLTAEEQAVVAAALQSRRKASKEKDKERERAKAAAAAAAAAAAGGETDGGAAEAGGEEGPQRGSEQDSDGEGEDEECSRDGQLNSGGESQEVPPLAAAGDAAPEAEVVVAEGSSGKEVAASSADGAA